MNTDFRLVLGIFEHPKIQKLDRKLSDHGVLCYVKLLRFVAQNKPGGVLSNMDADDIEIAAGFKGEAGQFISTLVSLRLLDSGEEWLTIHDWAEHNPYAAGSEKRSEIARLGGLARQEKIRASYEQQLSTAKISKQQKTAKQAAENSLAISKLETADSLNLLSTILPSESFLPNPSVSESSTKESFVGKPTIPQTFSRAKVPLPKFRPDDFLWLWDNYRNTDDPKGNARRWDAMKLDEEQITMIREKVSRLPAKLPDGCKIVALSVFLNQTKWIMDDPFPGLNFGVRPVYGQNGHITVPPPVYHEPNAPVDRFARIRTNNNGT